MINKSFQSIDSADIHALIANSIPESRSIEYKRDLTLGTDEDRKKFLAQIASFANSYGGDLIVGVSAMDGVPVDAHGIAGLRPDQEALRIHQIIRDGLDPRVPDFEMKTLDGFSNGPVLIIRIGRSWLAPHMITYRTSPAFFARNGNGKYPMDVVEIRDSFLRAEHVTERMLAWRETRLHQLRQPHAPSWLQKPPWFVLHVMPLASFERRINLGINSLLHAAPPFVTLGHGGSPRDVNIDGLIIRSGGRSVKAHEAYCQVYRTGQIEAVSSSLGQHDDGGVFRIAGLWLEERLIDAVNGYLSQLKVLEVPLPIVLATTLLGANGALYCVGQERPWRSHVAIDRERIDPPQVTVYEDGASPDTIVRPILDGLANAAGLEESPSYNSDGRWKPR